MLSRLGVSKFTTAHGRLITVITKLDKGFLQSLQPIRSGVVELYRLVGLYKVLGLDVVVWDMEFGQVRQQYITLQSSFLLHTLPSSYILISVISVLALHP